MAKNIVGFNFADADTSATDILREWEIKGQYVSSLCEQQRVCVQAGAHVGVFPINLSKIFEKVWTFEPLEDNRQYLIGNRKAWSAENLSIIPSGLSHRAEMASIRRITNNRGATQFKEDEDGTINLVDLDFLELKEVDLLWLDIEGYEIKALEGATNLLKENNPVIVLENNGLIYGDEFKPDGDERLREYMYETFKYTLHSRIMRDDIYIRNE
jgi:FkbM family methyltransferase